MLEVTVSRRQVLRTALATGLALNLPPLGFGRTESDVTDILLRPAPARAPLLGVPRPPTAVWGYDSQVPGPVIRVRQGQRLRVTVDNALPEPTAVHWHGLRVPNAMDGVPGLTQKPIEPGERYIYEFVLPDAGTYWYHSHFNSSEQLSRGLYGPLIIEERNPLLVDRDLVWMLDDWRLTNDGELDSRFDNGHDRSHAGRLGNTITVNGHPPAALRVRPGERLRLRLINAANARIFSLQFQGHRPRIIALDGQPITPHEAQDGHITLGPAMRVDLLLEADGRPGERFAVMDVFYPGDSYRLTELVYSTEPLRAERLPDFTGLPTNELKEPDVDNALHLPIILEGGAMGSMRGAELHGRWLDLRELARRGKVWALNGTVGTDPGLMAPMLTLERGSNCVMSLENRSVFLHPMHLHGLPFRVISRDGHPTVHREWQDTVLVMPHSGSTDQVLPF